MKQHLILLSIIIISISCTDKNQSEQEFSESKVSSLTDIAKQQITTKYEDEMIKDTVELASEKLSELKREGTVDSILINNEFKKEIIIEVAKIIDLLKNKDLKAINEKYIHPKYGITLITQPGVGDRTDWFSFIDTNIDNYESKRAYSYLFNDDLVEIKKSKLAWYNKQIKFSCETESFEKDGFFMSKDLGGRSRHALLEQFKILYYQDYTEEEYQKAKFEDNNTIRVIDTQSFFDIYLNKIDGKWYVTYINAGDYCSA